MKLYFEEKQTELLNNGILQELKSKKEIILFGAGKSGDYFFRLLMNNGIVPDCYCDNYVEKQGTIKNGIKIQSFESAIAEYPNAAICITSVYVEAIFNQIVVYDEILRSQIYTVMNTLNWETNQLMLQSDEARWIEQNENKLFETHKLLSDITSQKVMEGILNFRISRNNKYLDAIVSKETTYFDETLFGGKERQQYNNYIDGGSFTGDTLEDYLKFMSGTYTQIHCFEADATAADILEDTIKDKNLSNIEVHKAALWDSNVTLEFYNSGAGGSSIDMNGGEKFLVRAEAIDSQNMQGANFIKLDIEGAEYNALMGASQTIKENKPTLAISVYHKQDDLIKIPKLIHDLNPNYKLYLRQYMHVPFETVLYAI